jgi:hypothetical protein
MMTRWTENPNYRVTLERGSGIGWHWSVGYPHSMLGTSGYAFTKVGAEFAIKLAIRSHRRQNRETYQWEIPAE